jgi:S-adenosylmethionine decarboxylase
VKTVGRHLLLELWGCSNLESASVVERALREIVEALGLTLVSLRVHPCSPVGVTGVAIVSESHVAIHTWPPLGYAAVDVFACGERRDPEGAVPVLRAHFRPERVQVLEMARGLPGLAPAERTRPAERWRPDPGPPARAAPRRSARRGRG